MEGTIEFDGVIEAATGGGACIAVPFDAKTTFGTARSVRVVATYDGHEASSNVASMGGRTVLGIHKATREAIGKGPGDGVRVTVRKDESERVVEVPPELDAWFRAEPNVRALYEGLSFSHRREYAQWVSEAKRHATRDRRAAKAVAMIREAKRL